MNIEKISQKYDVEYYVDTLLFKNPSNFGIYHNISHYLDVISKVDHYATKEGFDKKDIRNMIISTIFHDWGYIPSRSVDDNIKSAIENFVKYSVEDKSLNLIIVHMIANINLDKIYGIVNNKQEDAIRMIKTLNQIGYYLDCDENDVISYVMRKSQEFNETLDVILESEIKKIENFECKFKSIKSDLRDNKEGVTNILNWMLKLYNEQQKANAIKIIEEK
jgi:DNA-binding Xre family transcriptional regulator